MGRQARIKRERQSVRADRLNVVADGKSLLHVTAPNPGAEHLAAEDGLFDDCPICQALRAGDHEAVVRLTRELGEQQEAELLRLLLD